MVVKNNLDGLVGQMKIFEEFFIIGVEKADIEAFELENPGYATVLRRTLIIYSC